ncbi:hypothetical protein ACFO9E_13205 [Streptomyces maoxianensis]|uniref:Uncharacterized protein n=1 Tax=Streptomyces maoxianensis TaxID=1459942 RepID=A0ABV9G368_9ACTN
MPGPPQLGLPWALAEAKTFYLAGLGVLARTERAEAKRRAEQDAPGYLAAEQSRLHSVHGELTTEAQQWWQSLVANDEVTVCETVNYAFADNPAAGCAVGVDGSVMSVVMRQHDIDSLPDQTPGVTSSGRPTLKTLTKRDRVLWWLTAMGSNAIATLKEGFAVAPGITAIDLAVITRMPDTQRLGFVAYGRWTRQVIESGPWQQPEDALRFLDIGQDVACAVTTTASGSLSSTIKPLDTSRLSGLQSLLDHAQDEAASVDSTLAGLDGDLRANVPATDAPASDHYRIRTFAEGCLGPSGSSARQHHFRWSEPFRSPKSRVERGFDSRHPLQHEAPGQRPGACLLSRPIRESSVPSARSYHCGCAASSGSAHGGDHDGGVNGGVIRLGDDASHQAPPSPPPPSARPSCSRAAPTPDGTGPPARGH